MKKQKQLLAAICITSISLAAIAMPNKDLVTINKSDQRYMDWCLDHELNNGAACPISLGYFPDKPITVILHVDKYLPNSTKPSDPVHLGCGKKPGIVNPGESYTCVLDGTGDGFQWWTEPAYRENGVNGTIFWAE